MKARIFIYLAWVQSILATSGSLYYSEIKHYTPCILCWYQRIFMYPLVLLLAIGILRKDKKIYSYILPMSVIGWFLALYHALLQNGVLPESIAPCILGASCTTKHVGYFGFITIPVMSLTAFSVIIISMYLYKRLEQKKR